MTDKGFPARFTEEEYEWLREHAHQIRESMNSVLRRALQEYRARIEKGEGIRIVLMFEPTTYTHMEQEYEAIEVSWEQTQEILGRDHTGDAADDESLVEALLETGAPEWVRDAEGWVDESGWGLIGPEIDGDDEDTAPAYRITYIEGPGVETHVGPWYADTIQGAREKVADLMEQELTPEMEGLTGEQVDPEWAPVEAWCEGTEDESPWYCIERRV